MKKIVSVGFLLLGLLLCFALALGTVIFGPSGPGANERLAPAPVWQKAEGGVNDRFLSDASDWYGDHFAGRQTLINAWAKANAAVFSVSASEDVLLGRDGWLFYASTLSDYTGSGGMSDRELAFAARNLLLLQEYCETRGMVFAFAPVPNKNTLYGDWMPKCGNVSPEHDLDRLCALLAESGVHTAELRSAFAAEAETLYFAHDSHWTSRGAALGADVINAAFGRESRYFAGEFTDVQPHQGDLFEMLYPTAEDGETDILPTTAPQYRFADGSGTRPDSITIRTLGEGSGTLFAWRDSFGNLLYPYLADSFAAATFSRAVNYNVTVAEAAGADTVLIELVERNLRNLADKLPVMPAPVRDFQAECVDGGRTTLTAEPAGPDLPGYTLWQGVLSGADAETPVWLLTATAAYECFRLSGDRVAAYLPETETVTDAAASRDGRVTIWSVDISS